MSLRIDQLERKIQMAKTPVERAEWQLKLAAEMAWQDRKKHDQERTEWELREQRLRRELDRLRALIAG